jgi:hypothetical protein
MGAKFCARLREEQIEDVWEQSCEENIWMWRKMKLQKNEKKTT